MLVRFTPCAVDVPAPPVPFRLKLPLVVLSVPPTTEIPWHEPDVPPAVAVILKALLAPLKLIEPPTNTAGPVQADAVVIFDIVTLPVAVMLAPLGRLMAEPEPVLQLQLVKTRSPVPVLKTAGETKFTPLPPELWQMPVMVTVLDVAVLHVPL